MKRSAGVLVYRKGEKGIEIFLEHMGGPYWKGKDNGAWSLPKGEYTEETAIEAALREFAEETGYKLKQEELVFLGSNKQSSGKLLTIFMAEHDFDATKIRSNLFELEWPPKSGKIEKFLEMDRAEWFLIEEAKNKILKGQIIFIDKLMEYLMSK